VHNYLKSNIVECITKEVGRMMNPKCAVFVSIFLLIAAFASLADTYTPEASNRVKINFGETPWKFQRSDPANAQTLAFNDAGWKDVGIPHTWNDTDTFLNQNSGGGDGSMFEGTCWYRKHFTLDSKYSGRKIFVEFEGVHVGCQVYCNGTFIPGNSAVNPQATHVLGFIGFIVDLTGYTLNFGGADNVLAVRVANGGFFTYPGFSMVFRFGQADMGIFRPVWMHITDKIHVPANTYSVLNQWGTYVATLSANAASATVRILTNVQNENTTAQSITVTTKVVDASNTVVLSMDQTQSVAAGANTVFDQKGDVANPHLWYPNNSTFGTPYMYKVYHIVKAGTTTLDVFQTPLGIRTITWDANFPYFNGNKHYLWGASNRYDYPALGTAIPTEQVWRDIKLCAGCGGNLWRPGHSAEGPVFVEACDAYGVMIMQPSGDGENNWAASPGAYQETLKKEIHRDMVIRDRNNPSILAWEASNGDCYPAFCDSLRKIGTTWDSLAPRKQSVRGKPFSPLDLASCTVTGCEIGVKQSQPQCPAWGAEAWGTAPCASQRDAYDFEIAMGQAYLMHWKDAIASNCFGLCQWYMFETPGEAQQFADGSAPGRSFGCSMMDFNRIPKMLYKMYSACWIPYSIKPVVYLAHHWNRSGAVRVNAFSNCAHVQLFINGVSQGIKAPNPSTGTGDDMGIGETNTELPFQCYWDVTWASGTLLANGLDAGGNVVCSDTKRTAGAPDHIVLSVEPPLVKPDGTSFRITNNGTDAAFVLATVVDASGIWCPADSHLITFAVSGPASYRGGSDQFITAGKPVTYHAPMDPELTAEGGMCKVAVRALFTTGTVTVTATSPGLGTGTTTFAVGDATGAIQSAPRAIAAQQAPAVTMIMAGTQLRYFVSAASTVALSILDASGKIVLKIPASKQDAGWHSVRLASSGRVLKNGGVYFARCLVNGRESSVKKIAMVQ
jgi:hypothetical protein